MEVTNDPTLTWAVEPNKIPLGLTKKTFPFELIEPNISEPIPPVTRFKMADWELGKLKLTVAFWPTLKLW